MHIRSEVLKLMMMMMLVFCVLTQCAWCYSQKTNTNNFVFFLWKILSNVHNSSTPSLQTSLINRYNTGRNKNKTNLVKHVPWAKKLTMHPVILSSHKNSESCFINKHPHVWNFAYNLSIRTLKLFHSYSVTTYCWNN